MSITLDLPPKIEALLRQRAESNGQDISQMAIAVLTLGLSLDDNDFWLSQTWVDKLTLKNGSND
ncbi:hypothetical protein [Nostoc sp. FACHB-280]|uniref:hypothetical protein n=1 Tax=Nostoc sp. FACHB-280 TaxID=2692839 RepID=UPI00168B2F36|nr:hypothetical protein [Nostoc sp. FACHB-280]MBD2494783.1 hypothetical protein [Nostoc sp. FACHB-280]